jgi:hypothetical protein
VRRWGRWLIIAIFLAILVWLWTYLFPSPDKAIRKRLTEVAQTASMTANETPVAKLQNSQKLASFCTPDVEVAIDAAGQRVTCNGKDELFQAVMFARSQLSGSVSLEFLDPVITLTPNKQTAFVNLTLKGRIPNDRDMLVQECKFTFKKVGRAWLIRKVETVKTLSKIIYDPSDCRVAFTGG